MRLAGVRCLACTAGRLVVTTTRRPSGDLTIRYRRCKACHASFRCEDRIAPTRPRKNCTRA